MWGKVRKLPHFNDACRSLEVQLGVLGASQLAVGPGDNASAPSEYLTPNQE